MVAYDKAKVFGSIRDAMVSSVLWKFGEEDAVICIEWPEGLVAAYNVVLVTRKNLYTSRFYDPRLALAWRDGILYMEEDIKSLSPEMRDLCLEFARDYRKFKGEKPKLTPVGERIPCYVSIYKNNRVVNFFIMDFSPWSKEMEEMLKRTMESLNVKPIADSPDSLEHKRFSLFLDQVLKAVKL